MIFTDYPGHFWALLLLLGAAVWLFVAFATESARKVRPAAVRLVLVGLQYAAIAVVLVILWNPSSLQLDRTLKRNTVLVLFDTSQSMSLAEAGDETRLDRALRAFETHLRPSHRTGPEYRLYGFDRGVYYSPSAQLLRRWGSRTDLAGAVSFVCEQDLETPPGRQAEPIAGAILFTDGQADDKSLGLSASREQEGFPVVVVGVGLEQRKSDLVVTSLATPARVAVGGSYEVQVSLAARRLAGRAVTLELLRDGGVIESRRLDAQRFTTEQTAGVQTLRETFEFEAGSLGRHVLTARVPAASDEANTANNVRHATVDVVEHDTLELLLYCRGVNFDVGKIRQALARDPRVRMELAFDLVRDPVLSRRAAAEAGYVQFPSNAEQMYKYDMVVLGPCDLGQLGGERAALLLYRFVTERGGSLMVLPGRGDFGPSAWTGETAKVLLPSALYEVDATDAPPSRGRVRLTFEGRECGILSEDPTADDGEPIGCFYRIGPVKPAAGALVQMGEIPLVCAQRVGRGKVCLINSAELFRLYREDKDGGLLFDLMSGLVTYLSPAARQEAGIELFFRADDRDLGKVRCTALVFDGQFCPAAGANVLLELEDRVIRMEDVGHGRYETDVLMPEGGSIVATVQAERNGVYLGRRTATGNVSPTRTEMSMTDPDRPYLQALAGALGGRYIHVDELDARIGRQFKSETRTGTVRRLKSAWPSWPVLTALCALLSANWFLRRAKGLV